MLVGEDPQPGRAAADLPAGLVDVLDGARPAPPRPAGHSWAGPAVRRRWPLRTRAAEATTNAGEGQQDRGALAVRDAEAMLQVGGEAEQARAVLDGGGAQGVGGLLGVTALDAAEAGRAAGHRDAEAGDDRLGLGQVDLVLVVDGDRGLAERRVALRAVRRQRDLDGAIDLLRRRCGSMAGRMPGLAPRPLGVGLGRALGEGGGLPLARPPGLLQLGLEPFHLGAELVDLTGLTPGQVDEFLVGGRLAIHDGSFTRRGRVKRYRASGQRPGNQVLIIRLFSQPSG